MKNKKINLERYEYLLYTLKNKLFSSPFYEEEVVDILEQAVSDMALINHSNDFFIEDENIHMLLTSSISFSHMLSPNFPKIKEKIIEIIDNKEFFNYIDNNINILSCWFGTTFIHFSFNYTSNKEKYLEYYFKCATEKNEILVLNNHEDYEILRKTIGDDTVYSYLTEYVWKNLFSSRHQDKSRMITIFTKNLYLLKSLKEAFAYQKENSIVFESNHNFEDVTDFIHSFPSTKDFILKCINIDEIRKKDNKIILNFNYNLFEKEEKIKTFEELFGKGWGFVFNSLDEELSFENLLPSSQLLLFKAKNQYKNFNEDKFYYCLQKMNKLNLFTRDENGYYEIKEKDLNCIISQY